MELNEPLLIGLLNRPRDVRRSWSRFAPELTYGRHLMPPLHDARLAAVLVLLYRHDNRWRVPLIKRAADVTVHSGQVSFPGGQIELGESPEVAALREFKEELGASPKNIRLCGRLTSTYIYASHFFVVPCVAIAPERPCFALNAAEVANLLEPSLEDLRDPGRIGRHEIERRGLRFQAPHIEFGGCHIWGATSMMLAELLDLLRGD